MAETRKLSVGQALDKLRRPDVQSKQTRLDEKMDTLDEDIQRMRAARRRLERDQRVADSLGGEAQRADAKRNNKDRFLTWLAVVAIVAPPLVVLIAIYAMQ